MITTPTHPAATPGSRPQRLRGMSDGSFLAGAWRLCALVVVLALAGCGGGSDAPPSSADPPPTAFPRFGTAGLDPVLDTPRGRTAFIGRRGGTLAVEHADGTRSVLSVPEGALSEMTAITMTPASAVGGLPLEGGLVAAVDLQPSGLVFAREALLEIHLPAARPRLAVPFGWTGAERRFALAVPGVDATGGTLRLPVAHFSGFGLGIPGPSQLDALAGEMMALAAETDPILAASTGVFDEATRDLLCNGCTPDELAAFFASWLDDWWDLSVKYLLDEGTRGPVEALVASRAMEVFAWVYLFWVSENPNERIVAGRAQDLSNLRQHHDAYTQPACNGSVANWQDWLRIPDELRARVVSRHPEALGDFPELRNDLWAPVFDLPGPTACAYLRAAWVDPPSALGPDDFRIPMTLRTWIQHPGGTLPVAARAYIGYGTGASGPPQVDTGDDGEAVVEVGRDLTVQSFIADADVHHLPIPRFPVMNNVATAIVGPSELLLQSFTSWSMVMPLGHSTSVQARLEVDGQPVEGIEIELTLRGPGKLEIEDARSDGFGVVRGRYTAPSVFVPRAVTAIIEARATHAGRTYTAVLELHPAWADLTLEADTGSGWVPATNRALTVDGDGPVPLRAKVALSGDFIDSPPLAPPSGSFVDWAAAEPVLARNDACCAVAHFDPLDAEGTSAGVAWQAGGDPGGSFKIDAFYPGVVEGAVNASVTLERRVPTEAVALDLPPTVPAGVSRRFTATVNDSLGRPVAGASVALTVIGGGSGSGGVTDGDGRMEGTLTMDAGATSMTVRLVVTAPGGEVLYDAETTIAAAPLAGVQIGVPLDPRQTTGFLFVGSSGVGSVPIKYGDGSLRTLEGPNARAEWRLLAPSPGPMQRFSWAGERLGSGTTTVNVSIPFFNNSGTDIVLDFSGSEGAGLGEYEPDAEGIYRPTGLYVYGTATIRLKPFPTYYAFSAAVCCGGSTAHAELVFTRAPPP